MGINMMDVHICNFCKEAKPFYDKDIDEYICKHRIGDVEAKFGTKAQRTGISIYRCMWFHGNINISRN